MDGRLGAGPAEGSGGKSPGDVLDHGPEKACIPFFRPLQNYIPDWVWGLYLVFVCFQSTNPMCMYIYILCAYIRMSLTKKTLVILVYS